MGNRMFQDFEDGQFSAQEEIDRLKAELREKQIYILNIERELARYRNGVEVDTEVLEGNCMDNHYIIAEELPFPNGQRVKVLILTEDSR